MFIELINQIYCLALGISQNFFLNLVCTIKIQSSLQKYNI